MLFLKKHAWWLVSIVVGLCISTLILSRSGDPPVLEDDLVPSGEADAPRSVTSSASPTYQPPPLGETEDTGHWEGNTWHQKPAPEPKQSRFWSEDPDKLADRALYGIDLTYLESRDLARRIIRDYPYSEAALKMRYKLKSTGIGTEDESAYLKDMLKYHPNSARVLTDLARSLDRRSPEEAIAFAQKSQRIDPSNSDTYRSLGTAYQRLGDYKTALVHLKTAQKLSDPNEPGFVEFIIDGNSLKNEYEFITYEISMIEAGTPRFGPDPKPAAFSMDVGDAAAASVPSPSSAQDSMFNPFAIPYLPSVPPVAEEGFDGPVPLWGDDPAMRGREGLDGARSDAARHPQQEFDDFRHWLETIESAKRPADLDNFLMREMATQLQGGHSEFTPDRLIRAFEVMQRHGQTRGMAELEKRDAELARELSREPPKKRMPPVRPKRK